MPLEPRGPRKTDDFAARHLGKTEDPDLSILSGAPGTCLPTLASLASQKVLSRYRSGSQNRHREDLLCANCLSWTGLRAERNKLDSPLPQGVLLMGLTWLGQKSLPGVLQGVTRSPGEDGWQLRIGRTTRIG